MLIGHACAPPVLAESPLADLHITQESIYFTPLVDYERIVLSVRGESGVIFRREFEAGASPLFKVTDENGASLPDGSYTWELRAVPVIDAEVRERLRRAREAGDEAIVEELQARGELPTRVYVQNGSVAVVGGAFVVAGLENGGSKDQVIPDDLIVDGSLCVGFDCVVNESFGFDTIRLKEQNTRIKFEDTSTAAGFASRDWQITANDDGSGGANKFSIDDIDGNRTPFTLEAGAPTNSLYIDSSGRLGLGTATPVTEFHSVSNNTPILRLEQDGSNGFTPQTWEVGGNEANFFVRDITNSSRMPLRIRPGAGTSSIDISADGEVGIGTSSPDAALHVLRTNRTAAILVEEATSMAAAEQTLLTLRNKGTVNFNLENTSPASTWQFRNTGTGGFTITLQGTGGPSLRLSPDSSFAVGNPGGTANLQVQANGNATLRGSLTQGSDRSQKKNIAPVDGSAVLDRLAALPISLWTYQWDAPEVRHLGPMAQDFHAAFGLGDSDKSIATLDTSGVALAAIQELDRQLDQKDEKIAELEARLAALEALVRSLSSR